MELFIMNACGLVVEYNPFHNGHVYHIRQAKKKSQADCIIAVMSGSFLQRGEPAIVDKFHRTKAALASGIDLVLELPYPLVYKVVNGSLQEPCKRFTKSASRPFASEVNRVQSLIF